MATIKEMLESVQECIDNNDLGGTLISVSQFFNKYDATNFGYFLLNSWFDNIIPNPFDGFNISELHNVTYKSSAQIKRMFKWNIADYLDFGAIINHNWLIPSQENNVGPLETFSFGISALLEGFTVYYCPLYSFGDDEPVSFLILDEGVTFNDFIEDLKPYASQIEISLNPKDWKLIK